MAVVKVVPIEIVTYIETTINFLTRLIFNVRKGNFSGEILLKTAEQQGSLV